MNDETEAGPKEWAIRIAVGVAAAVIVIIAVTWIAAGEMTGQARREIGRPPLNLEASTITFASASGVLIHGWLSRGKPGQGVVLLLHDAGRTRRDMLTRAEFLHTRGYSVLLIDFQAHGENRGYHVTWGNLESRDVIGALQYLRHKLPREKVGVIAVASGADAFVLADDRPPVAAVVLEQMYPTIEQAITGRARSYVGPLAPLLGPLLFLEVQWRLDIPQSRLRPIEQMSKIGAPVLIVNGTDDNHVTLKDARALLAAASEPKQLWAVQGAGHVNLYAFAKSEYERRVSDFFARYLPGETAPQGETP